MKEMDPDSRDPRLTFFLNNFCTIYHIRTYYLKQHYIYNTKWVDLILLPYHLEKNMNTDEIIE